MYAFKANVGDARKIKIKHASVIVLIIIPAIRYICMINTGAI